MSFQRNRSQQRRHIKPIKRNELQCILSAQRSKDGKSSVKFEQEQIEWDKKWNSDKVTYCLTKDSKDIENDAGEWKAVWLAMNTWSLEIPLTLQLVKKDKNPDITIEFADSYEEPIFKDNTDMLAFAHFPGTPEQGTIKLNEDKLWSLDGKFLGFNKTYNMVHTLVHEIGHALGLTHAAPKFSLGSVMSTNYNGTLQLSNNDIDRIVAKYDEKPGRNSKNYKDTKKELLDQIKNLKILK